MRAYIHKLRAKPEDARKRIVALSVAVSMVFVGTIWIYGLGYRLNNRPSVADNAEESPFRLFGQSMSGAYKNVSASVGSISWKKDAETKNTDKQIDVVPVEPKE